MEASTSKNAPAAEAASETKKSSHGPVWDDICNRVKVAVFRHHQSEGKMRYTIGINRSYKDDEGHWQNTHFFDERDLPDVIEAAKVAREQIDRFKAREEAAPDAA